MVAVFPSYCTSEVWNSGRLWHCVAKLGVLVLTIDRSGRVLMSECPLHNRSVRKFKKFCCIALDPARSRCDRPHTLARCLGEGGEGGLVDFHSQCRVSWHQDLFEIFVFTEFERVVEEGGGSVGGLSGFAALVEWLWRRLAA